MGVALTLGALTTEAVALRQSARIGGIISFEVIQNIIPEGKLANHLFKGAGKLADTPANRALIQKISNDMPLIVDRFGKSWFRGVDANGKGIYTYAKNGFVKGAGYTDFDAEQLVNHKIKTVGAK